MRTVSAVTHFLSGNFFAVLPLPGNSNEKKEIAGSESSATTKQPVNGFTSHEYQCPLPPIPPGTVTLPPDAGQFREMMERTRTLEGYNWFFAGRDALWPTRVKVIERVPTSRNVVYLTFDDGPFASGDGYEAATTDLLKILKEKKVSATFFFQGFWAWKHPEILKEALSQGSNVGNHTYHHPPDGYWQGPIEGQKKKFSALDPGEQSQELLWGRASFLWATWNSSDSFPASSATSAGILPYFRSPHGSGVLPPSPDQKVLERIAKNGHIIINGNLRLSDAKPNITAEQLIATYRDYFGNAPSGSRKGEILWLHSGLKATVEALPVIVDDLRARGYEVAALPSNTLLMAFPEERTKGVASCA